MLLSIEIQFIIAQWVAPPVRERKNEDIDKRGLYIDRESNRVPSGYETDALTIELYWLSTDRGFRFWEY